MTQSERRELLRKIYAVSTGVHYTPGELAEIYAAYSSGGWKAVRSTIFLHKGIDVGEKEVQRIPRPSKVRRKTHPPSQSHALGMGKMDWSRSRWIGILALGSLVGMALWATRK